MPADATEVIVAGTGKVHVAPEGTALPTDMSALNAAFVDVGFVSEDGVTFTDGKEIEDIPAWQSFYPIRKVVASKESTIEFVMRQWNEDTVEFAFGGGSVTETAGVATYFPPAPGEIDMRAMVIEWEDGDVSYRLVCPRGMVSGEVSTQLVRTAAADLPIAFSATPVGAPDPEDEETQPWYLVIDDADFSALT